MTFFVICFGVGIVFLIVTAIFGGLFEVDGHHFDFGGHGDVGGAMAGFSPVSPTFISFFLTVFGGVGGVCMSLWQIGFVYSLLIALVTALGMATVVYIGLAKVFDVTQGGVEVNVAELVGREAEVTIGIPEGGTGEVVFITAGGRLTSPARSADGKPIPHNSTVVIQKIVGNTYIVGRKE
jgi:hypothetical protein